MGEHFQVSPSSVQGLGLRLKKGKCSVSKELALVKEGSGRFKLLDLQKEALPTDKPVLKGAALHELMQSVANGIPLQDKEFQVLTSDHKFRNLCRLIPGMETPSHKEDRLRTREALSRGFQATKVIGRGLESISRQGFEGRYVGQDQGDHPYWIRELVLADTPKSAREIDMLISGWENDKSTQLSLKEWEKEKHKEWEGLKTGQDFLPWIVSNSWKARIQKGWENAHPGEVFDETKLSNWKDAQPDPDLFLPIWLLKEFANAKTDVDLQKWKVGVIEERKEQWEKFKKETGVSDLSFEDHENLEFAHSLSGSVESTPRWILRQLWEKSLSKEDFKTFVLRLQYKQTHPGDIVENDFKKWCVDQEQALHLRHEGSHLPVTFDQWKAQQDDGILIDPAPFILLDENERKKYLTTCNSGQLERNNHPYNTGFDKTRHSGAGYAIFVIGPDHSLYTGSHIGGVFHHSSFLGEGAVMGAGEVKTSPDGTIIELSSKSGHYQPQDSQNLFMLRYFRERGADLSQIPFTSYSPEGKTITRNALEYLNELETGGISGIDPSVFQ